MANFIPKTYKKEQITVRLELETLALIDEISRENGLSRSELINQCVEYALKNMRSESEIKA